jgi:hypothetical protein
MGLNHKNVQPTKVSWTNLKTHRADRRPLQYEEKKIDSGTYYKCYVVHNNLRFFTNIYPPGHRKYIQANYDDFINNYKPTIDSLLPTDYGVTDGSKIMVHQTSRVLGTITYFTCASDDQAHMGLVGGGVAETQKLKGHHKIGDPATMSRYLDINTAENETYIHEGYIQWKDALNDELTVSIVPEVTTVSAGSNTFYNLYGGYLVIPAAGDGTINIDNMVLCEMPVNEFGKRPASYWNADYNTTTHLYENVTAAPLGNGAFNMFTVEVTLDQFAHKIPLLGSGFMNLQTSDASALTQNLRIKVTTETIGVDHDWWWNAFATFHRRRTV